MVSEALWGECKLAGERKLSWGQEVRKDRQSSARKVTIEDWAFWMSVQLW